MKKATRTTPKKYGTAGTNHKGDREIISVSIPTALFHAMEEVCDHFNMNRSAMISSAVLDYLERLGKRVGEP